MNFFDHLDNICSKNVPDFNDKEVVTSYDSYMINRYVSMSLGYIDAVLLLNVFDNIPKQTHFKYLCNALPKKKMFFPYIKKPKDKFLSLEDKEILNKHLECGSKDFDLMMEFLSEDDVKMILSKYKRYGKSK